MSKPPFEDLFNYKSGRRNRKSLAVFLLTQMVVSVVLFALILVITPGLPEWGQGIMGLIVLAISLPLLMSQFCAMSQRCRDIGYSGMLVLLNFVPFVSMLFQVLLLILPGTKGPNKYGPDPRGDMAAGGAGGSSNGGSYTSIDNDIVHITTPGDVNVLMSAE